MARSAATDGLAQARAAQNNGAGGEVERRDRTPLQRRQDTIATLIKRMGPEMAAALPQHLTPERLVRITTTVMRQTPKLAQCDEETLLGAIMTCAQLGLEPGPTGQAYLVPYGNTCTFILGYRGMLELARRSDQVETIYAEPVYKLDEFIYTKGLDPTIEHKPYVGEIEEGTPDNPLVYVYAVAKYKGGGYNFVVLHRSRIEAIRKRSRAANNGPWVTDYVSMALKTAVRQLAKWMPQSVEFQTALAAEGKRRTDLSVGGLDGTAVGDDYVDGELVDQPTSGAPDGAAGDGAPVTEPVGGWPETAQPPQGGDPQ